MLNYNASYIYLSYKNDMREIELIKFIVDHHFSAIKMAEMAFSKEVPHEITEASERIIDDQTSEIDLLLIWLQDWYGEEYQPKIMPDHLEMIESLDNLDGYDFETLFLEKMADHHREIIEKLEEVDLESYSPQLKELAESIISSQKIEIHILNRLLKIRV